MGQVPALSRTTNGGRLTSLTHGSGIGIAGAHQEPQKYARLQGILPSGARGKHYPADAVPLSIGLA